MPAALVKTIAAEKGIPLKEAEKRWDKAKDITQEDRGLSEKDGESFWQYVVGVFKKSMGISAKDPIEEKAGVKYSHSSVMVQLPWDIAKRVMAYGKKIPEADLNQDKGNPSASGIENDPHITVRYGIADKNPAVIFPAIDGYSKISFSLGKVSAFTGHPKYDVLKIDVESEDLRRIYRQIGKHVETPGQTYRSYRPHITIGYLKKGESRKYAGDSAFYGVKGTVSSLIFSDGGFKRWDVSLGDENEVVKLPVAVFEDAYDWEAAVMRAGSVDDVGVILSNVGLVNNKQKPAEPEESELKEKAVALKGEYEKEYQLYSKAKKAGFIRRVRDVFAQIDPEKEPIALMALDMIATRLGVDLKRGESKKTRFVVDIGDEGKDIEVVSAKDKVLYHATDADPFDEFDPRKMGSATDDGLLGRGVYLSSDKNIKGKKKNLITARLSRGLKFVFVSLHDWNADKSEIVNGAIGTNGLTGKHLSDKISQMGYDGVILDYSPVGYDQREYVVFDHENVTIEDAETPSQENVKDALKDIPKPPASIFGTDDGTEISDVLDMAGVKYVRDESGIFYEVADFARDKVNDSVRVQGYRIYPDDRKGKTLVYLNTRDSKLVKVEQPVFEAADGDWVSMVMAAGSVEHINGIFQDLGLVKSSIDDDISEIRTLVERLKQDFGEHDVSGILGRRLSFEEWKLRQNDTFRRHTLEAAKKEIEKQSAIMAEAEDDDFDQIVREAKENQVKDDEEIKEMGFSHGERVGFYRKTLHSKVYDEGSIDGIERRLGDDTIRGVRIRYDIDVSVGKGKKVTHDGYEVVEIESIIKLGGGGEGLSETTGEDITSKYSDAVKNAKTFEEIDAIHEELRLIPSSMEKIRAIEHIGFDDKFDSLRSERLKQYEPPDLLPSDSESNIIENLGRIEKTIDKYLSEIDDEGSFFNEHVKRSLWANGTRLFEGVQKYILENLIKKRGWPKNSFSKIRKEYAGTKASLSGSSDKESYIGIKEMISLAKKKIQEDRKSGNVYESADLSTLLSQLSEVENEIAQVEAYS